MKLTVDTEELRDLAQQGADIFLRPDGEQALLKLLDMQQAVEEALNEARRLLEQEALKLGPHFSCIKADNLAVYYRAYGARYRLDETRLAEIPENLYRTRTYYSVVTPEVERLAAEQGKLPEGIAEVQRPRQIIFSRQDVDDGEAY